MVLKRNEFLRLVGTLPVSLLSGLIAWSYYAFVFRTLATYVLERSLTAAALVGIWYHLVLALFIATYWRSVSQDPGYVDQTNAATPHGAARPGGPSSASTRHSRSGFPAEESPRLSTSSDPGGDSAEPTAATPFLAEVAAADDALRQLQSGTNEGTPYRPVEFKRDGRARFCSKCLVLKPDRTHHCSVCGRCVLKMDHHCPWINNCVGWGNYRFFFQFLVYGVLLTWTIAITTGFVVSDVLNKKPADVIAIFDFQWALLIILAGVFGFTLTIFLATHAYLLTTNQTTIESMEGPTRRPPSTNTSHLPPHARPGYAARASARRRGLYDLGDWRKNAEQVMGSDVWKWFLPIGGAVGDGRTWALGWDTGDGLV